MNLDSIARRRLSRRRTAQGLTALAALCIAFFLTTACSARQSQEPDQAQRNGELFSRPRPRPAPEVEWTQHAYDAQRTSWSPVSVPHPWRWKWAWNGPNARGGIAKVTTGGSLPRNVQPVTGAGLVFVAAGSDGVYALRQTDGRQVWRRGGLGDVRSTVAFDRDTSSVFAVSSNGRLYKLRASNGAVLAQHATGQSSNLPLPPLVLSDRVIFSMGDSMFAVDKNTLRLRWRYRAGATVAVPPAYSATRDSVIVATEPDLFVHAVRNRDGSRLWRVRPVHESRAFGDPTEFRLGWPVVADRAGLVLVKVRLDWEVLWVDWPQTNRAMRSFLLDNPGHQALFALRLDDGSVPFIVNVGHGGYGDSDYLPMGFQPVVRTLANGRQVAYGFIRAKHAYDSRWDSHLGEMLLDSATVPGYQGGDVRFIRFDWPPGSSNPFLLTDEQPNLSMAGDQLLMGHWEAGLAAEITDRSDGRGSFSNPIRTRRLSTVVTSQEGGGAFSPSHYLASGLFNTRDYDFGFYIYFGQGPVYDRYWSEYATWVVSQGTVYFRSCDGAIVALESGSPASGKPGPTNVGRVAGDDRPRLPESPVVIPHSVARRFDGRLASVSGTLRYAINNGKHVLLAFSRPHQGTFKAIIRSEHWSKFPDLPDRLYRPGQPLTIFGRIEWYQGDPAIYVKDPAQVSPSSSSTARVRR